MPVPLNGITVKVPAPPGQTVIDCKVHLDVIPDPNPSHFPHRHHPAPPRRMEISINQRRTMRGGGALQSVLFQDYSTCTYTDKRDV